jgi:uncharacterized protein YecT (DUF1311 family)
MAVAGNWLLGVGMAMRALIVAMIVIQVGLGRTAHAENSPPSAQPISEALPLFDKNHCRKVRDPADQLFCGDPELNDAAPRLSSAIEARLDRLSDRRLAIEENAEWIKNRNASCGIFGNQAVSGQDVDAVRKCLLKETEERIAILTDPNFDCLAADTTAGMLICSEPELVLAAEGLNNRALALIARLRDSERKDAFAEYARWTRDRDRKCNLVGKDNVPIEELSSSGSCLADYMKQKTAEIEAARDDPRRVFGQHPSSPLPDAGAVDLCVTQIHSANSCENFLSVSRVFHIDDEVADQDALVTAEVEMIVLSPFAVCSPVASGCTGTCWDLRAGKATTSPSSGSKDSFAVTHRIRIEKSFRFRKADSGGWRCDTTSLQPVDLGIAVGVR